MRLELPAGAGKAEIQVFTPDPYDNDQEWVKPTDARYVDVLCIGCGGGGGAGGVADAGADAIGGGGGGGGGVSQLGFMADTLPDTLIVFVGRGLGGVGVTAGAGSDGRWPARDTLVRYGPSPGILLRAGGGLPGSGGGRTFLTAERAPTAENARSTGQFTSAVAGLGGSMPGNLGQFGMPNAPTDSSTSGGSPGPGGGGGAVPPYEGMTVGPGGWGGAVAMVGVLDDSGIGMPGLQSSTASSFYVLNPGVDALVSLDRPYGVPGPGGSGGGASVDGHGGNGAPGGAWGGGGGGGGGARTGFTSGAGGDGGPGLVMMATYF